jgi:hypothetical protein
VILYHGSDHASKGLIERIGLIESERDLGVWMSPHRDVALFVIAARFEVSLLARAKALQHDDDATMEQVAELTRDVRNAKHEPIRGVLVTLELADDYPFRYREEHGFGYCAPVARIPFEGLRSIEDVEIGPEERARLSLEYGGFGRPRLTPEARRRFAEERRRWTNEWPKHVT